MKKLFLLLMLLGVLAVGCENLLPNEQVPNSNSVFVTDGEDVYIVGADGGEITIVVTTNVEYSVIIPDEATSWISVTNTRTDVRIDKLNFSLLANDSFVDRTATIKLVDSKNKELQKIVFVQKCYDKVFEIDADGNYLVDAEGGEVNVAVTTNLEYNVAIPEEAQSWLSVADSRATVREETLTFTVLENETFEERSASVELVDSKGDVLQTIGFIQSAVEMCPSNEIWYTNGSTTEPTAPYNTYVFGANIVSNTFDAEKECWIIKFDGDVTEIGYAAFAYCYSLTSVIIPDSVTTIGNNAFQYCRSIISITIGDSVTTIGEWAFSSCSSLTSVAIGDGVTEIGNYAFDDCYSLTSITIPDSVTTIGDAAFSGCSSLTSVTIPDSVTTIGRIAFAGCSSLREFNGKFASDNGRCLIIDGTLNSFAIGCGVTEYTIPDSVTTIGSFAFDGCRSLTSVTIPDSVTTIGDYAFARCSSLTSVTIGDSVTTIGDSAFYECSNLTIVTIGDSVTTIGSSAFGHCNSLTSVTIPDSVTTIKYNAFYNCSSLTSVTIPDSVTTIGEWAFYNCSSLTSVTIPDSVTTIGEGAFCECRSLTEFRGKYASEDGRYLIIDGTLNSFAIGCGVTEYTIPDSVTTIGYGAFWDCSSLTIITIPDSVTTIGYAAFNCCSSLTSVTIGDSVTTIRDYAFAWCSSLPSVTIGDSVTTIGDYAFHVCSSLTSVYCRATTPPTAMLYDAYWRTFDYNASGRIIYVPVESVDVYKSATGWSDYTDAIVGYEF